MGPAGNDGGTGMLVADRSVAGRVRTVDGAGFGCGLYGPGHQLHWAHWKKAAAAPCTPVSMVLQDDTRLEIITPERSLTWFHHDADLLAEALRSVQLPMCVCPEWQALRIDGYWFNCAPSARLFTPCC